jgi:hypothetical protein
LRMVSSRSGAIVGQQASFVTTRNTGANRLRPVQEMNLARYRN